MNTVWDVRRALVDGIVEVELLSIEGLYAKVKTDDSACVNGWGLLGRGDWRPTREEALVRAEQMRKNRLATLRKEIVKLENMAIAVRALAQGAN